MTDDELRGFLAEQKIVSVATLGPNGRPHLMPLWYVPDGIDRLDGWTYAASQKAKNLEREPAKVAEYGAALFRRYTGSDELAPEMDEMIEKQSHKRVGLRFTPTRTVTWDHRKLGGTY